MSTTSRDPIDELADFATRTAKDARRVLAGPDGPLAFALGLGLLAMAEVTIYAEEIGPAMVANLLATLPLAPRGSTSHGRRERSSSGSCLRSPSTGAR